MTPITSSLQDTIVAVSTPAGSSLRAVIRLSGPEAITIAERCLELTPPVESLPRYGVAEGVFIFNSPRCRAPVTVLLMRRPHSYTREDVLEIQTFGSPVLLEMMTERLVAEGARLAEPGEFTRRAFLNGRINLAQAEAVRALVHARTVAAHRRAMEQLVGRRARALHELRDALVDLCARVEAAIDFSDQDIEIISSDDALERVRRLHEQCRRLVQQSREAPAGRGVPVALFGRPNVGKSSLMNALLGERRSIVTAVPGTTRDVLEATVELDGVTFRLLDMAGLRETQDTLEAEGVAHAQRALQSAEIGLFLLDASEPLSRNDHIAWQRVGLPACVIVWNKCDLPMVLTEESVREAFGPLPVRQVSCVTGQGIAALKRDLVAMAVGGRVDASVQEFEPGLRQREVLRRLIDALHRVENEICNHVSLELVAFELREALEVAGELTGESVSDDILDRIFSDFCIGK